MGDDINERVYPIEVVDSDSFKLLGFDSTKWDTYTSGGTCYRMEPDDTYANGYTYDLPSDCLKPLHLTADTAEFEILGAGSNRRLLTTEKDAVLVYNALEETTGNMLTKFFI